MLLKHAKNLRISIPSSSAKHNSLVKMETTSIIEHAYVATVGLKVVPQADIGPVVKRKQN